ncbi:DoxX family membrane protein [Tenacibaculum sp. SSH1-16]|uniref:DoxX family protein n=1 Tax=Tenacibaculum sp. SSH1-16 TaxID=3136667 RepID=UPI0032C40B01|nr:hypothetical protein BACT7_26830 [Tenacibaculum mesophilum]
MKTTPKQTAYTLLRITMGINFFGHGLARLPKIPSFRNWMVSQFQESILPESLVYAWATVLPFIEFFIGFLLIIGLFTYRAAIIGAIVIVILILGSCLTEHWEWAGGQMLYALFYFFIISQVSENKWSLDNKLLAPKSYTP